MSAQRGNEEKAEEEEGQETRREKTGREAVGGTGSLSQQKMEVAEAGRQGERNSGKARKEEKEKGCRKCPEGKRHTESHLRSGRQAGASQCLQQKMPAPI